MKRANAQQSEAFTTAQHYFSESLRLYHQLNLTGKIKEVEKLLLQ